MILKIVIILKFSLFILLINTYFSSSLLADEEIPALAKLMVLANSGNAEAQYTVGRQLYNERAFSDARKMAIGYLTDAAQQEHVDAQYYLALIYCKRNGKDFDTDNCLHWLDKAYANGDLRASRLLEEPRINGLRRGQRLRKSIKSLLSW